MILRRVKRASRTGRRTTMVLAALMAVAWTDGARAEALSTTSAGIASRTITYTKVKVGGTSTETGDPGTDPGADFDTSQQNAQKAEVLDGPTLCERISTPSSLGVELGAGGCVQTGGLRTFAHTISSFVQLLYYPLASRSRIDNDGSVRMDRQFFGDLYLFGQGGFAKVTHQQIENTDVALTSDLIEFGGGLGWSYRVGRSLAVGVEGSYLVGSILSNATSGSSNTVSGMGLLTVFL